MARWPNMPGASAGSGRALADGLPAGAAGRAPGRWADLGPRLISAAVLIVVALGCLWLGGAAWWAAMAAAAVVLAIEWAGLCGAGDRQSVRVVLAASLLTALALLDVPVLALAALAAGTVVAAALTRSVFTAAGVPYLGLGVLAVALLRRMPEVGLLNTLALLLVVWASDTGAFTAGRLIGGPKLAPAISPGKTWAGAAGGLLASAAVAALVDRLFGVGLPWRAAAAGAALSVATQAGDLLESWIKRRAGVKDSGRLIPGHGGLLDRVDGLLTAAPLAMLLAYWAGMNGVFWR